MNRSDYVVLIFSFHLISIHCSDNKLVPFVDIHYL